MKLGTERVNDASFGTIIDDYIVNSWSFYIRDMAEILKIFNINMS